MQSKCILSIIFLGSIKAHFFSKRIPHDRLHKDSENTLTSGTGRLVENLSQYGVPHVFFSVNKKITAVASEPTTNDLQLTQLKTKIKLRNTFIKLGPTFVDRIYLHFII